MNHALHAVRVIIIPRAYLVVLVDIFTIIFVIQFVLRWVSTLTATHIFALNVIHLANPVMEALIVIAHHAKALIII